MKFFQNRAVAIVITVAAVIASTLLNVNTNMRRDYTTLKESFFSVSGKTPVYYVDAQISAAASLATVADHYDSLSGDAVRSARKALIEAEASWDISDIYDASTALTAAVDELSAAAASSVAMTEADKATFADGTAAVAGARRNLLESDYNVNAYRMIRKNYSRLPGSFFVSLLHIPQPELFGEVNG